MALILGACFSNFMSGAAFFRCSAVGTGSWPERVIESAMMFLLVSKLFQQCRVGFRNKFIQNEFSEYFPGERENGRSGWVYLSGALEVQFKSCG